MELFKYQRTDRRRAITLIFNGIVLSAMYWALLYFHNGTKAYAQIVYIAYYALILVNIILSCLAAWLIHRNLRFEITITPSTFTVSHPSSDYWSWELNVLAITSINHHLDVNGYATIYMIANDGKNYPLCPNYAFSRKHLYDALKIANPTMTIPDNIYRFKYNKVARRKHVQE